jgi:crossover junction endodeoxyribonuclease RusA
MVESSKRVKPWREAVAFETAKLDFEDIPFVRVSAWFLLPRPKSHYGTGRNSRRLKPAAPLYPGKYPDLDKLCRSTLDALRMGGAYRDDAQVVTLHAFKVYAHQDEEPGALIRLTEAHL